MVYMLSDFKIPSTEFIFYILLLILLLHFISVLDDSVKQNHCHCKIKSLEDPKQNHCSTLITVRDKYWFIARKGPGQLRNFKVTKFC